jgi:tartrate-resistant acid phosphatase type 5
MRVHCITLLLFLFQIPAKEALAQGRVEKKMLGKKIEGIPRENGVQYFLVVGDWGRNGQGDAQAVADWMGVAADQFNARFVISTGDNFYCCGVASTEDHQWVSSFENVFRSHSLQIPWYVVLGNHDYQGNVQAQIEYSKKSQRWKMPARYFTNIFNDTRFIFIDSSPFIRSYHNRTGSYPDLHLQDTTRQLAWLDSVLTQSRERWKIVVGHHPIYSVGEHGSEPDMKRLIEGKLEQHHVHVYFAGHDHSLQSLQRNGSRVYHVISGGGSERTPVKKDLPISRFAKESTGFMLVAQSEDVMKVHFIDSNGKIIYTETIQITIKDEAQR